MEFLAPVGVMLHTYLYVCTCMFMQMKFAKVPSMHCITRNGDSGFVLHLCCSVVCHAVIMQSLLLKLFCRLSTLLWFVPRVNALRPKFSREKQEERTKTK